jgi:hypothetical protein
LMPIDKMLRDNAFLVRGNTLWSVKENAHTVACMEQKFPELAGQYVEPTEWTKEQRSVIADAWMHPRDKEEPVRVIFGMRPLPVQEQRPELVKALAPSVSAEAPPAPAALETVESAKQDKTTLAAILAGIGVFVFVAERMYSSSKRRA